MKLGTLLFAAYLIILSLCFAYPGYVIVSRLRRVYLESAEEPLVDTANVLAELVGQAAERGELDVEGFYGTAQRLRARDVSAHIYETIKPRVDLDVYITDAHGIVLFDSRDRNALGADYAHWKDVSTTLGGGYGARVSSNPKDHSLPRVLYVAAPVRVRGELAGVLTVIKPTTAVREFLHVVRPQLIALGALAAGASVVLAFLVSLWVTQQVSRLTRYADAVREGQRVAFPKLASTELLSMGLAFEKMRSSLAGQAYIEQYVRALTHEIKSPISAIRGAAEILETPNLDAAQRARFLGNIQRESYRIQDLIDRMLELSELEVRRALPERGPVSLAPILRTILEAQGPMLAQKQLRIDLRVADDLSLRGDAFLLHLALSNLLKNAIEFSPSSGSVRVACDRQGDAIRICVEDEGPGIPDYALSRVFERFYSLERPDTGRKSTGLGLNFVQEIAALHHGSVSLENRTGRGLRATLTIPAA